MFDINKIYTNSSSSRFLCDCYCDSEKTATYIMGSFLGSVREYYFAADLYTRGATLILDTPKLEKTKSLVELLNNAIANMH